MTAPAPSWPAHVLPALLGLLPTGVLLLRPVYAAPDEAPLDFAFEYLNPAAQGLLDLPERPLGPTLRDYFPAAPATDLLRFCHRVFTAPSSASHALTYERAGRPHTLHLTAQRSEDLLLVSFSATPAAPPHPTPPLPTNPEPEAPVTAEGELRRRQLYHVLDQAPAMICIFDGPRHVFEFVNPPYQALVGQRPLVGKPIAEAMPELAGQPIFGLLDQVYQTGEPFYATEMLVQLDHANARPQELEKRYYNFVYQARYNLGGSIDGILVFAYDVTPQVRARQQVQELNVQLQTLNQELEGRVWDRTRSLLAARREAEGQRRRLERLFMEAPAAICILNGPDLVFELVNPGYQQLFPDRELLGRPLLHALPELATHPMYGTFRRVFETGVTHEELSHLIPLTRPTDGLLEDRYFNYVQQARYDELGRIDGVLVFAFEVTQQVRAQQQAERNEQEFRTLTNTIDQLVWTATAAGEPNYYNEQWYRYTGARPGAPVAEWYPAVHPDDLPQLQPTWQDALLAGTPYRATARLRRADGEYRWFLVQAQPLLDSTGHITRWFGTLTDIHEQKRLQQTLLESEQYFRQMADNVPAVLWVTDEQAACTYLNQQWYAYTGQQEVDALGYGWLRMVHPDDEKSSETIFMNAHNHQAPFSLLYRLRAADGRYRWHIDSGSPRFDVAGRFEGYIGTVIDVHEQQLAELALQRLTRKLRTARDQAQGLNAELRLTNEQLLRTNVDLDNFIYTASHDLRAPITNIEGLLYALQMQLPSTHAITEEAAPLLGMMADSIERFKRTIDHLSDVVKLQKEHDQPITQVALAAVIEDVRLDLAPLIAHTQATLELDVAECPVIAFSAKNLRSVVYNLLSNAFKYRHPDRPPHVRLRCYQEGAYTVLAVADNGLGLDLQQQPELFMMFRRLHSHVEGSGIGLYMVKRSVENAGGHVRVESELGLGSTFSVYFRR